MPAVRGLESHVSLPSDSVKGVRVSPAEPHSAARTDAAAEPRRPVAGLTDETVHAAVAGDQRAIGVLFEVLNPRLNRYLALMVGRDAEDVSSDTWIEVLRSLPRFVGGADTIGAWVVGIGRNRALTHFRRARSRPQVVADSAVFAEVLASESDTYASVEEADGTADALARIASLPKEQAEAVFLRSVVGLDAISTADVLGKKPGAIRTASHRGLKKLETQLEAEGRGRTRGRGAAT